MNMMTEEKLAEIEALLGLILPIETRDTPDYAELQFGEHATQAMTMDPKTWITIGEALPSLLALARDHAKMAERAAQAADDAIHASDEFCPMRLEILTAIRALASSPVAEQD